MLAISRVTALTCPCEALATTGGKVGVGTTPVTMILLIFVKILVILACNVVLVDIGLIALILVARLANTPAISLGAVVLASMTPVAVVKPNTVPFN